MAEVLATPIKKIIHIDMDCFYASVEMRENPSLVGKPVAVGGSPDKRGVLATCNYEARKFGLHSAMSSQQALKKCPNLVLISGNMELYKSVSQQIREIFQRYTSIIEPLSLDEAFLDVTDCDQYFNSATWIAEAIRNSIWEELHLTASAGVAPLKFLAKIASDINKPNGQFVIPPEEVTDFIHQLDLKKIPGVGKVTYQKLLDLGFKTCADIKRSDQQTILQNFGKFGHRLWDFSHAIDNRKIEVNRIRKSIGVENTLITDIDDLADAHIILDGLFRKLLFRIERNFGNKPLTDFKKLGIKLKFDDFTQTTLEKTTEGATKEYFVELLHQIWKRRGEHKIRLIGINVQVPEQKATKQLDLWD
ncbi:DNA polymerase IV [Phocoenobacter skyensis]|uniref:DNA polymerase IV n=1 Tax=Phocoenobacter skyensis TaxID=97481 RepID=A0A1H7TY62_9PAST|nr:DNA polymerase IV [Pasteurella skyensis]MDP8078650.1 DNA polymerase IV [Pasteurella skyensis]MDP8084644.1 DNA polymerase IV [Pasteurella skyensis]MDP8184210.1 DNA polymerase IV [Pasteurella skyensis]QLB22863.1 DNA polymerase IV [Pasteurella skyensis]SEL89366.1 DNA polymerase-4 [Pasteurella skyensis]